jgi:hypothetical protein
MQAFNPDRIEVQPTSDEGGRLGFGMTVKDVGGVAYVRISPELRDFLKLCHEKHGVVGFEYDFDNPGLNFGVILSEANKEANPNGKN